MKKAVSVTVTFSDFGCPLLNVEHDGEISLKFFVGKEGVTAGKARQEMVIAGNKNGLTALAGAILAVAESSDQEHHLHIDEEVYGEWYSCPQGITLTISRAERP